MKLQIQLLSEVIKLKEMDFSEEQNNRRKKSDKPHHQTHQFCTEQKYKTDLDDYFQSFYFLIRGPSIL